MKRITLKSIIQFILIIIGFCVFVYMLCFVNLHELIRKLPVYAVLRTNLDFLSAVITIYGKLFLVVFLVSLFLFFKCKYKTSIVDFTLAGFSFIVKDSERIVKARISNYLNTKRSLFYYYEAYDNLYDVMCSWHEILLYIREQLCFLEESNSLYKENSFNRNLQELVAELNGFLTKYQSDYRRWYKSRLKREVQESEEFRSLFFIQREYPMYNKIMDDIRLLNKKLRSQSDIWGVDCKKWEKIR